MSTYTPIMNALLALLQTKCGTTFKTYSRRFVMWEKLNQVTAGTQPIEQPALFLYDGAIIPQSGIIEYDRTKLSVPNKRVLDRAVVIYAKIPGGGTPQGIDQTTPGGDVLFPLIEAVEAAVDSYPDQAGGASVGAQTLGGLVYHCWIQGNGYTFVGDIDPDGQGMAIIPVKIMIP